jgi:cell division protease FtsH
MANLENPQNPNPQQPPPRISMLSWLWWIILAALLIWNAMALLPQGQPRVDLPYGDFISQVKADNVADVTIAGGDITGDFVKPIEWPASPTATAPATEQAQATPTTSPLLGQAPTPQSYSAFHTTFPETIGDSTLLPLLEQRNVHIDVNAPQTPWFMVLLTDGLPILLLIVFVVWMGRNMMKSQVGGAFNFGRTRARRMAGELTGITFADVAGADEAKGELQEVVDFLRNPKKYHDLGARIPRGVLLVGAPGTGKTLMAKAVAGEADVPFFNISASEFVEMFVGVGASRVRDLFTQAKAAAPAIVFIDEMDAVGRRRGAGLGAVNDEREQTLNQLLVEMDGFDERHEVIILAATNRPDVLDPALLRPGRFDREVTVGMPDRLGREAILQIHTRELTLDHNVDLGILARTTTGLSGAELANLCNEAALTAARHDHDHVTMADFDEALDRILLGGTRPALIDPHDRSVVAYHESGHALVAWLMPDADPVHKVSIIPHGRALGVTEQMPGEDRYNYSHSYLVARLAVMLGGRVAEEIVFGDVTTGAENDLVEATRLARRMVTRWGMGSLGPVAFKTDEEQPFLGYEISQGRDYSETTATRIDQDVQGLLNERHEAVHKLLSEQREQLDRLAEELLRDETIDETIIEKTLGARAKSTAESE